MRITLILLLGMVLAACSRDSGDEATVGQAQETAPAPATEVTSASVYEAAVASEARSEGDRARDVTRRPAEVLAFVGIEPGMTVLDVFSGGGYYSELLAGVVGASGKVIAHSNEAYLTFVGDEFSTRYANDRLPNVELLMAENNDLELDSESLDAVMLILSYHDLFNDAPEQGWPLIDVEAFLAELYKGLKPGGLVAIVDHYAEAGASKDTGNTLHRIDPAIVRDGMAQAGFELLGESDVLRNPDDDYSRSVFEPGIRGNTDRFLLRYCKPE